MPAMNMRVLQGREFSRDSESDRRESVIVSEEFVRQMKWKGNPIGQRIVWRDTIQLFVIGVVKDVYARALFRPVEPMMFVNVPRQNYELLIVRAPVEKISQVNDYMNEKWKKVFPGELYHGEFIENKMRETVETNNNAVIIFGFIGFFAALMSATGLYTLISLHIVKRLKEIGIRKVLGASLANILHVISFEFIAIIVISSMLGGVAGYFMVDISMKSAWIYYEKVSMITFFISAGIVVALAVTTVGYKTLSTAGMNPVKTLRDD